ncbi:MAG: TaqI-like C-terminal specificity domain-containing protein [Lachnospiraceae bacterium]|nr:TaqI-like C-terminal specificity domain-containing protein [Lachnospiraceae bacterium]
MDEKGYPVLNTAFMISKFQNEMSPYVLLGILNSRLIKFYWKQKFSDNRKQFPKIKGTYLEQLPINRNNYSTATQHDLGYRSIVKMGY